jgi:ABC-type dipeptide/oligopeptide/nickel transport system permease subunit
MAETTPADIGTTDYALREHRSMWYDAWRRLISSNTARAGMVIVAIFVFSSVYAHFFWEYDPKTDLDYSLKLKPPTLHPNEDVPSVHLFGTDKLGRDIFRRVVHGGWNSLRVGLVAVGISLSIGVVLGILAGFFEGTSTSVPEDIFMYGLIGFFLGLLPAWISEVWLLAAAFFVFGILSATFGMRIKNKSLRMLIFAGIGFLTGGAVIMTSELYIALACAILGALIGLILGMTLKGQFLSSTIMRAMDIILSFPSYLLAIAIVAFLGPGLEKGMIAIGVVGIPVYARVARSSVLSVMQKEYILAAESTGEGHGRIMTRHVLPNIMSPLIVQTTMGLASAILSAAALGFLGLGAIPPEPEWGAMLGDSYRYLTSGAWWAVVFPGVAIMLCVLGFNLLGDGLRDALDPKLRI